MNTAFLHRGLVLDQTHNLHSSPEAVALIFDYTIRNGNSCMDNLEQATEVMALFIRCTS